MKANKCIVFIGDSLTEYFDWQRYFLEHDVINLGVSGETVQQLFGRIDRIISSIKDPDFIFLMTGINNIAIEDFDIFNPYKKIVSKLSSNFKDAIIIIQSILPVNLHWIDNNDIKAINKKLKEIADEFNVKYLDVFCLFIDLEGRLKGDYLLDDGVHLSDKGYDVWVKEVEGFLKLSLH
ncbi:1-alkyl-2-acetylglycerophosphocholine esterase [Dissulfurispira thermophila]|uniref:1-alkyl-2-acetylglycerophosphocholine esterase n=2 Tax=root TaxID=1 RepID=A0A7G1H6C9_9BACT|nr:GDSL-type esterase/lipase family protein [Dissulfurispira thermophila]BCB97466.1 1-alkyl-2-acetylglycerophosphocholine esterase [Dissulfurispira thermophila]